MPEVLQPPQSEVEDLRTRLTELEQTLEAIRGGEVDALVAEGPQGPRVYTLQTPDQPYRELVEQMSEGAAFISEQGTLLFCNQRLAEMLGQPHAKLMGAPVGGLIAGAERPAFISLLERSLKAEVKRETQLQRADGSLMPVQVSLRRVQTDHGCRICMVATDVTRLKEAAQALQDQADRYQALVTTTSDGYWRCDPEGRLRDVNDTYCEMSGYSREELLKMSSAELEASLNTRAVRDEIRRVAGFRFARFETQHRRKDGSTFDVEISASYLHANSDLLVFVRDITRRRYAEEEWQQMEEELRQMNAELESQVELRVADLVAVNKELESFNFAIAHDLRAPLRHISCFSDLLIREAGAGLSEKARHFLAVIQEGVNRMSQLIDDLLNLSRVGRAEVRKQVCGVRPLVDEVIGELAPQTEGRKLEWRLADLPFVECDPSLFKQVLVNLLSNAVKFTRGREPAVIEIGQTEAAGEPVLYVRDNGVGFDMKYADKLFGIFQRLHRQEDFEGTGVGLAIAERIMRRHGGQIWAEAALNQGATFYLKFGPAGRA